MKAERIAAASDAGSHSFPSLLAPHLINPIMLSSAVLMFTSHSPSSSHHFSSHHAEAADDLIGSDWSEVLGFGTALIDSELSTISSLLMLSSASTVHNTVCTHHHLLLLLPNTATSVHSANPPAPLPRSSRGPASSTRPHGPEVASTPNHSPSSLITRTRNTVVVTGWNHAAFHARSWNS